MVEILEVLTSAGRWLQMHQDSKNIFGAHLMPDDVHESERLTIMWPGQPPASSLVSFCQRAFGQLDVLGQGTMSLLGRAFAAGQEWLYTGADWPKAGSAWPAQLLRFECAATPKSIYAASPRPTETIIVWAALNSSPAAGPSREGELDEDDNVGINLNILRIRSLEQELTTLIAENHLYSVDAGLVREALRFMLTHLRPRPQALAASAA